MSQLRLPSSNYRELLCITDRRSCPGHIHEMGETDRIKRVYQHRARVRASAYMQIGYSGHQEDDLELQYFCSW